jgi:capsular polysaccharide biosynthesis protein
VVLDFDTIECRSAFDLADRPPRTVTVEGESLRGVVELTELRDVLYLPNVLEPGQSICLAEQRFVPKESILDCWSAGFFKETHRREPYRHTYSGHIEATFHDGPVCVLGNLFSRNFGHWTEELLKVAVLERAGVECQYVIPTLPAFARDFLNVLGIEQHRVVTIDRPTMLARALFTTAVHHENVAEHPAVLFQFRDFVRSRLTMTVGGHGTRLWLERGAMLRSGGVTLNRGEVHPLVTRHGFEILDMATLPVAEQVRAVSDARVIAGPHGSQFVHVQFMPVGSSVIECFSPMYVNPSVLEICRVLRHSYHQIVSRCNAVTQYVHGRDCVIDCAHLSLILDSLPSD